MSEYNTSMRSGDLSTIYDVSPFDKSDVGSTLDGNWSCRLVVVKNLGDVAILDQAVTDLTDDNRSFRAFISPTESTGLIGNYIWAIQVQNLSISPPYRKEIHIDLNLTTEGVV